MEAYLLDPLNPMVISCEKNVLPAWEAFRSKQASAPVPPSAMNDEQRLARLMAEREAARQAKERSIWNQASSAPGTSNAKSGSPASMKPGKPGL
jgi:hypothetical protein